MTHNRSRNVFTKIPNRTKNETSAKQIDHIKKFFQKYYKYLYEESDPELNQAIQHYILKYYGKKNILCMSVDCSKKRRKPSSSIIEQIKPSMILNTRDNKKLMCDEIKAIDWKKRKISRLYISSRALVNDPITDNIISDYYYVKEACLKEIDEICFHDIVYADPTRYIASDSFFGRINEWKRALKHCTIEDLFDNLYSTYLFILDDGSQMFSRTHFLDVFILEYFNCTTPDTLSTILSSFIINV